MKLFLFSLSLLVSSSLFANTVNVHYPTIPILADGGRNIVAEIEIESEKPCKVGDISYDVVSGISCLSDVEIYYAGSTSLLVSKTKSSAVSDAYRRLGGSQAVFRNDGYVLRFKDFLELDPGKHYIYLSVATKGKPSKTDMTSEFSIKVKSITIDGEVEEISSINLSKQRLGIAVRQSGDDGIYSYRIPGLVTTNKGTLVAVYDIRHTTSIDLQENIDVGISRSLDGGISWEPMQTVIDMGEWGGRPQSENGIGDPSILVDEKTGRIFIIATWVHGLGNRRAWNLVGSGMTPKETAQIMMVYSDDDGKTWSEPKSITPQIKNPEWTFTLAGPGRGITMKDGTLVFPIQYIDKGEPRASIMFSKDHGNTWHTYNYAKSNTTEAQVAELSDGSLILSMRDNRGTGRALAVTKDLGKTWKVHPYDKKLIDPVCMAGLLSCSYSGNNLLFFSNCADSKQRKNITVKMSFDDGMNWHKENSVLLDDELLWGYSCLTMVDSNTLGIVYESSKAQILFQMIDIKDLIEKTKAPFSETHKTSEFDTAFGNNSVKGLSGHFSFILNGSVFIGGGCNFPDKPLVDGGKKVFYDDIYLKKDNGKWEKAGRLPIPLAYSSVVTIKDKAYIIGGSNSEGLSDRVFQIGFPAGKLSITECCRLPFGLDQASASTYKNKIYIAGGNSGGAKDFLFEYDPVRKKGWKKLDNMPEPMIQPQCIAYEGNIFVFGGLNDSSSPKEALNHGYKYSLKDRKWEKIDYPFESLTFTGSSALLFDNHYVLFFGGVNRDIFMEAINNLTPEYFKRDIDDYRFNRNIYCLDLSDNEWSIVSSDKIFALAGASVCTLNNTVFLSGGELKPGIRTPQFVEIQFEKK